jgi:hypothetical protein
MPIKLCQKLKAKEIKITLLVGIKSIKEIPRTPTSERENIFFNNEFETDNQQNF